MSKIHILKSDNGWGYNVAMHFAVPVGTNTAGYTWKESALESGLSGATSLEVGTGPGRITQAEFLSIIAGDIIEIHKTITPGLNPTTAEVEALCNIEINAWKADTARILKYFGHKIEEM